MRRFCRKKAMPCHQHGKQAKVEGAVVPVPVGVITVVPLVPFVIFEGPLPP